MVHDRLSREQAFAFGLTAESLSVLMLRLKGYRIEGRNVRVGGREIDIVARRGSTIAIVEVKARATMEAALEAIGKEKRQRIASAARAYLARHPALAPCALRFDAVCLAPGRFPRHVVNAFEAPAR